MWSDGPHAYSIHKQPKHRQGWEVWGGGTDHRIGCDLVCDITIIYIWVPAYYFQGASSGSSHGCSACNLQQGTSQPKASVCLHPTDLATYPDSCPNIAQHLTTTMTPKNLLTLCSSGCVAHVQLKPCLSRHARCKRTCMAALPYLLNNSARVYCTCVIDLWVIRA